MVYLLLSIILTTIVSVSLVAQNTVYHNPKYHCLCRDWKSLSRIMEQGEKKITDDELKQAKSQVSWNEPCVYSLSSVGSRQFVIVVYHLTEVCLNFA